MKRFANALITVGVGVVSLFVLYSLKVNRFNNVETSIILFSTSLLVILGILVRTIVNKKYLAREKIYSRLIFLSLYFTSITYYLIKNII